MPDAPEVRFAQGQHLMLMAERFPEFADRYRSWAIGHFQYAGSPEVREYAPEARLALAGAMLDQGEAVPAVVAVLQLVERDASRDSSLMARCARAYGDPRLGAQVGGLFGTKGVPASDFGRNPSTGAIGMARGGSFAIGGAGGVDRNLLSVNGRPVARVSRGEFVSVSAANNNKRTMVFDLRGAVITEDLLAQMNALADGAAMRGALAGVSMSEQRMARRSRRRLG